MFELNHNILIALYLVLLMGCSNTQKVEDSSANSIEFGLSGWMCDTLSSEIICLPEEWHSVDQDKIYYFAYLDNDDQQTYFTIAKYDVSKDGINAEVYLKEMYRQLVEDKKELFEGYTLKKLKFPDKEAYYGEYYTEIDEKEYFTYSMLVEQDGHLYDIALKVLRGVGPDYKETFQKLITNLKIDKFTVFDNEDEIIEEQVVRLHQ